MNAVREDFSAILDVFERTGESLAIDAVSSRLTRRISRRTLQRRLAELVEQGKLSASGERKGRRYHLAARSAAPAARLREDSGLPVSAEAEAIRLSVTRSLAARTPIGYQKAFLERYRPNQMAYLRQEDRSRLAQIGAVESRPLPPGTYFRRVMDRLLIDLSWNSSRLEGNTYSLLETGRLLEFGETAEGKDIREAQMILNHKAAIELLAGQPEEIGFNSYTIFNLHALLSENLLPDPAAGGRLRMRPVGITGTVYHPTAIPALIEEHFALFLKKASAIRDPFEQALFAMVHLPYLQPFEDVNKRVSRLAANIPMVRHNLCPLSFVDVPQADYVSALLGVYELQRVDYLRDVFVWAYERSCARYSVIRQELGEPDVFRWRYRELLAEFVRHVVRAGLAKSAASRWIAGEAGKRIAPNELARFRETVETELLGLHMGNIARYRLRLAEFTSWQKTWR